MTLTTVILFAILLVIAAIFVVFCIALFYHVSRFSFFGDISQKTYWIFVIITGSIVLLSFIGMVINHLTTT